MKKLLCFLLTAGMLLQLTACGAENSESASQRSEEAPAASEAVLSAASAASEAVTSTASAAEVVTTDATETSFTFTRENFPVLDGSTSMVPLGKAIASALLGISEDDAENLISFNKTTQSLRNLMNGECDLVIAAEPDSAVFDEMKEAGFAYESETIAREALVFVVNEDNPVDNLTSEQVRKIYSGEITNWSEVGGNDEEIAAFQRNQGAGSQVMMEKLVMGDTPMAEAPEGYVATAMGDLIDAVKSYDNTSNAVGYTVYYYANDMQMAQGLKIISIDGVQPDADTLRNEEYPYINGYYSFLPAAAKEGSPARILYNWLVSAQGQYLLRLEGYVSVMEDAEQTYLSEANPVAADFSQLQAVQNGNVYTRLSEEPMEQLNASDDYGSIYPYAGIPLYKTYTNEETGESETYTEGYEYGFVTGDGTLITDPVYASASMLCYYDFSGYAHYLPFWQYSVLEDMQTVTDGEDSWTEGKQWYGYAALDGSFATDCVYELVEGFEDYILAIRDTEQNLFEIYDLEGNLILNSEDLDFRDRIQEGGCYLDYGEGVFTIWLSDGYWFMTPEGQLLTGPYSYLSAPSCGWASAGLPDSEEDAFVNTDGETLVVPDMQYASMNFSDGYTVVRLYDGESAVIDLEGNILLTTDGSLNSWDSGWMVYETDGTITYYDYDLNLLFGGSLNSDSEAITAEVLAQKADDGMLLKNVQTGAELTLENCDTVYLAASIQEPDENSLLFASSTYSENTASTYWFLDQNLNIIYQGTKMPSVLQDEVTEETYLALFELGDIGYRECEIDTLNAEPILKLGTGYPELAGGMVIVSTDTASEMYTLDGALCFRYCYFGGDS